MTSPQCSESRSEEPGEEAIPCSIHDHLHWVNNKVPVFGISGDDVQVIQEPTEFFDILKEQARRAQKRIVLASLYLGTGKLEQELVSTIHNSVQRHGEGKLQVEVLLDFTRGSRGDINSRTMLLPLLKEFDNQVQVSLCHSPDLRGWLKRWMPERWNEIIGLSHLKVYLFDDNLIMSGANLSDSYFTNRQDRYILIKNSPELANFFHHLVRAVSGLSFQLQMDDTLLLAPELNSHPYEGTNNGESFRAEAKQKLEKFIDPKSEWQTSPLPYHKVPEHKLTTSDRGPQPKSVDTWVFPLLQMWPFGITTDEVLTHAFFKTAPRDSRVVLASGYFNLTDQYIDTILDHSHAAFRILTAAPEANGFFNGAGVSGNIPDAYTHIARQFLNSIDSRNAQQRITLYEYTQAGWTFHAKGLWHYLSHHPLPYLTIIGSSNFGYRSVYRDLEAQLVVATHNEGLQNQLHQEQQRLFTQAAQVTSQTLSQPLRRVPAWVPYVTSFIRKFF